MPAAESSAFPVTVEHEYGTTRVEQEPTRVVSVGSSDQDAVLAFDVVPVGIRHWYGEQPSATWPWAQDELGGAEPVVLPERQQSLDVEVDHLDRRSSSSA